MAQDEAGKLSIAQEIMTRGTDYLRRIIALAGGQGGVTMSYLSPNCNNSFPLEDCTLEDCIWWVSGGYYTKWWCAICGERYDWRQPIRLLVVQTSEIINEAKVFNAHAVPQGLCGNLIDALKFLANQQEDGDGPIQNIVTNLGVRSRKRPTQGLREFIKTDNQRALEVGYLSQGMGIFKVRKPKVSDAQR